MATDHGRLVFVGAATLDAIALVDRFPEPDERVVAQQVEFAGGGPAATGAVAAARLGVSVSFVGAVGDDADGDRIVADLESEGVDVSQVVRVLGQRSGASIVVVDRGRRTRAICNRPAPALVLQGVAADLVRSADWVHVDHAGWGSVHRVLSGMPPGRRPKLSVDNGNPIPGLEIQGVDLYVPTYDALVARYSAGEMAPPDPVARALDEGARAVVATRGGDGAVAATADGLRAEVPGHTVQIVSTLGAGDVFHGALLAGVVHGYDLAGQVSYANAAAALSCRGADGRTAIPTHHDVLELVPSLSLQPDDLELPHP